MKASTSAAADSSGDGSKAACATLLCGKSPVQVARRNARERRRVQQVNMGFVKLRDHVPQYGAASKSKKLSKVETLRAAADYIKFLHQLLSSAAGAGSANEFAMSQLHHCASQSSAMAYQQQQQHHFVPASAAAAAHFEYYNSAADSTTSAFALSQPQQLCQSSYPQLTAAPEHHSFCISQAHLHPMSMMSSFEAVSPSSSSFSEPIKPSPTSELSSSAASFSDDYSMCCSPSISLPPFHHPAAPQHIKQEFVRYC